MVQYRHLEGSGGRRASSDGFHITTDLRASLLRGVDGFLSTQRRDIADLALPHRLIRDTYTTAGDSLLDLVHEWMRQPGFHEACPTYEEFLLTIVGILDPSVLRDAREFGYLHPAFYPPYYRNPWW